MTGNPNSDDSNREDAVEPDDEDVHHRWTADETQEKIDSDQWVQVHQAHYDWKSDRELTTVLVKAIAEAKDVDPLGSAEMPPLYASFDAAALDDTFFDPSGAGTDHQDRGFLTFHYSECKVVLREDGWISVYESR